MIKIYRYVRDVSGPAAVMRAALGRATRCRSRSRAGWAPPFPSMLATPGEHWVLMPAAPMQMHMSEVEDKATRHER